MARCRWRWRLAVLCPHLKKQTNKYGNLENYGMKMNVRHTQHNENVTQQAATRRGDGAINGKAEKLFPIFLRFFLNGN